MNVFGRSDRKGTTWKEVERYGAQSVSILFEERKGKERNGQGNEGTERPFRAWTEEGKERLCSVQERRKGKERANEERRGKERNFDFKNVEERNFHFKIEIEKKGEEGKMEERTGTERSFQKIAGKEMNGTIRCLARRSFPRIGTTEIENRWKEK